MDNKILEILNQLEIECTNILSSFKECTDNGEFVAISKTQYCKLQGFLISKKIILNTILGTQSKERAINPGEPVEYEENNMEFVKRYDYGYENVGCNSDIYFDKDTNEYVSEFLGVTYSSNNIKVLESDLKYAMIQHLKETGDITDYETPKINSSIV